MNKKFKALLACCALMCVMGAATACDTVTTVVDNVTEKVKEVLPEGITDILGISETYTVTFVADGETVGTATYKEGDEKVEEPAVPAKEHYTGAWESYKLENGDLTVNAVYTATEYAVTFKADGKAVETVKYTVENTKIKEPAVPAKEHYTGAWESYTLAGGNVEVKAVYTPVEYTVTFKADGKAVGEAQKYTVENKDVTAPTVPAKDHYTGAWESYTLEGGSVEINAVYTPVEYTITFVAEGKEVGTAKYTVESTSVQEPAVPDKECYEGVWKTYTFAGGDFTVEAEYTYVGYTVKFVNDDGTEISKGEYEIGDTVKVPADPTKAADAEYTYTFAGWDKAVTVVEGTTTYTATYSKTPIDYTVTFKADGAQVGEAQTYNVENKNVTAPTVPTKDHYTGKWETYELTTGDVVVNAVYTPVTYTVTFKNGEDVVGTVDFHIEDTEKQAPAVPEKTGYTGAWKAYSFTNFANQTVETEYTPNSYTITYNANGGTLTGSNEQTVTYDDTYVLATTATAPKSYQEFLGWKDESGKLFASEGDWTIAGNVSLTAVYSEGVTFETLATVPSYMTGSDTTESISIVEMDTTDGNKALEIKSTNTSDGSATSAPAMKVTLDFVASFFADESVDYIAFDAKSGATTTGNFRRVTIRASGKYEADPYENDNGFNGIRSDAWKTFYFSRTDYNNWVNKNVTTERFIATGNFTSGDRIYVDNIRPATAAEYAAGIYSLESGGLRVNDGGQSLLFYTPVAGGGWLFNIQVESGKVFSNSCYTDKNVTDGVRAVQFTKEAGSFQINFPSKQMGYTDIVTKTGYYAVDIYIPENSDATIAYQFATYPGVTPKKGGWTTVYVCNSYNVLKVTDTTGGTYVIDNIRAITEEEYYLGALGFEASGSGLRTHELDDATHSNPTYYYAGADHQKNTYSIAIVEGNGENDVSVIKNVSYSSEVVHGGAYSLCIEKGTGYMYMTMRSDSTANSLLKNGFTFWIYSTTAIDGVNTDHFYNGVNGKFNGGEGVTIEANTWTQITVTAEDMNNGARFLIIQGGGATAGTIYIDDICPLAE